MKNLTPTQLNKLRQAVLQNVGQGPRGRKVMGVTIPAMGLVKGVEEAHAWSALRQLVKEGLVEQRQVCGDTGWHCTYRIAR